MPAERKMSIQTIQASFNWAHLDTAPGAPVSDPASIQNPPETRRIGDRRSAIAAKSGAVSRCARFKETLI
jgi:hypothetical protein